MTIATLDQYIASQKQIVPFFKTAGVTSTAALWYSVFNAAGQAVGVLAGGETTPPANTVGRVPTDVIPGYPLINAFQGGAKGYLSRVEAFSNVACRFAVYDRLWVGGTYPFGANVTLSSQPSYSSRVPGGTDYTGLELWTETVTAFTGAQSIAVTYTNELGTAARTTGTVATGATPIIGRCLQIPLGAADNGIQKVETVVGSVATVGTFNLMILRPLFQCRIPAANMGDVYDMLKTGLPEIFTDSALYTLVCPDSTSTGAVDLAFEIANG